MIGNPIGYAIGAPNSSAFSVIGVSGAGVVGTAVSSVGSVLTGVSGAGAVGSVLAKMGPQIFGVSGEGVVGRLFPSPSGPVHRLPLFTATTNRYPANLWKGVR